MRVSWESVARILPGHGNLRIALRRLSRRPPRHAGMCIARPPDVAQQRRVVRRVVLESIHPEWLTEFCEVNCIQSLRRKTALETRTPPPPLSLSLSLSLSAAAPTADEPTSIGGMVFLRSRAKAGCNPTLGGSAGGELARAPRRPHSRNVLLVRQRVGHGFSDQVSPINVAGQRRQRARMSCHCRWPTRMTRGTWPERCRGANAS